MLADIKIKFHIVYNSSALNIIAFHSYILLHSFGRKKQVYIFSMHITYALDVNLTEPES